MTFADTERLIERYDAATSALDQAVTDRISKSMDAAFRAMVAELERQYPIWESQGSLYASQRRLLLLNELGPLLAIVRPEQAAEYERLMSEALQLAHTTGATLADELVRTRDPGYPLQDFTTIPIEAAVAQARDGVGRLYRYDEEFRTAASGIVEQGLIQGWGTKRVQGVLERELGVAKSKAETLARTEVMSALNTASQERYERNNISYIQVFNTPSERLCGFCAARHGNVYEVGQVSVPFHPRCRDVIAPWLPRWQQQGLTDDAAVEASRAAIVAEFEAGGGRLSYGPTSWEKKAGLTAAPTPVWKPGDAVAAAPVAARAGVSRSLPQNHAVTINPRYKVDSLDRALDAIATPGAAERVQQFRQFAAKHGVQVVLPDLSQPIAAQLATVKANLSNQRWAGSDAELAEWTQPLESAIGYTADDLDHIVINTSGDRRGEFRVRGGTLNSRAADVLADSRLGLTPDAVDEISDQDTKEFLVYIHEMGHQVHYKAGTPSPPRGIGSVTQYGAVNEREWFAEHFSLWLLDAEAYAQADPDGARFIEDTVRAAIAADRRSR